MRFLIAPKKNKNLGRGLSALMPDVDLEHPSKASLEVIPVSRIKPNPHQPRTDFKTVELEELASSIREKGVIQPLVVRSTPTGYELIAGERRLRASKLAGLTEVPVRILEVTGEIEMLELSLIENLQRHDLNPVELAEGYRNLHQIWELTQEQIAQRVGKKRATVANTIRLLELPLPIRESLRSGEITTGHAKAILSLTGAARQSALWKKVVELSLTVRQTEELAGADQESREKTAPRRKETSPVLLSYADRMRRTLGTQVKIARQGKKGSIKIEFYSDDDLIRLVELLSGGE